MATKTRKNENPAGTLASQATKLATKDGKIKFGAPVSSTQVDDVKRALKGKQVARFIGCPMKLLKSYAVGDTPITKLPPKTRDALRAVSDNIDKVCAKEKRVNKTWPRENAAIIVTLSSQRKPRAAKAAPAPVETTTGE